MKEKKQDVDEGKSICREGVRNNCGREYSKIHTKKDKAITMTQQ
jgi:hypothetical protein